MNQKYSLVLNHDLNELQAKLNYLKRYLQYPLEFSQGSSYFCGLIDSCVGIINRNYAKESLLMNFLAYGTKKNNPLGSNSSILWELQNKIAEGSPVKVAIIDDDETMLRLHSAHMKDVQLEVFSNPQIFSERIKNKDTFDCIICDKNFGIYSIESTTLFKVLKKNPALKIMMTHESLEEEDIKKYSKVFNFVIEKRVCRFSNILEFLLSSLS